MLAKRQVFEEKTLACCLFVVFIYKKNIFRLQIVFMNHQFKFLFCLKFLKFKIIQLLLLLFILLFTEKHFQITDFVFKTSGYVF